MAGHLLDVNLALVQILLLMSVVYFLTRRRTPPDVAARAPDRALALRETLLLLGYRVLGLVGGYLGAKAFGWHPFGLHMAGTIYGTHAHLEPAEVLTCAGYNLLVYAVLPLIYFRRRYSPWALSLRSSDRAASRGRRRDPVYGQRLGARLGLPRLCPAHTYRYPHIVDIFRIR